MCGIAGSVAPRDRGVNPANVARMQEMLRHRGPDGEGMYTEPGVALAMRRLAIIDVAGGDQPIHNEDKSVWIVFNGEIYNFQELRKRLIDEGHRFETNSDTETVVHAYEQYGTDCPKYLRGMFAFAIWDRDRQRLFMARDRVGKKPLLYAQKGDTLIFASEFRAMLAHPEVSREIDPAAIHHYMSFMCVPAPLTAFRDIRKLEPGHWLTWERGRIDIQSYWSLDFTKKRRVSEREAADEAIHLLRESVRLRMIADVPVGAFLSGGIDSSAIVALMAEQSSQPVKTFSIGFDEADFDELAHARRIAKRYGTDHHEFVVRPDAAEVLPILVDHYGEPYADSSSIPTYYVARETRRHVTVALNGDGGDEAFAGYRRYAAMQAVSWLRPVPALLRRVAAHATFSFSSSRGNRRSRAGELRRFAGAAVLPPPQAYMAMISAFDDTAKRWLYAPDFAVRVADSQSIDIVNQWLDYKRLGMTDALLQTETMTYLPDDLLVKVDIASMAVSLEARSPFLDHHVLEFAASLPPNLKLHRLTTKYLLKKALRSRVPAENLGRKKMGFGVPVGVWLRRNLRDLLHESLLPDRVRARGLFRPGAVQRLIDDHLAKRHDHTNQLWTLVMLELWFERFIDSHLNTMDDCTSAIAS
jgi:asparagine synthase (glutamine-hydrolysing)